MPSHRVRYRRPDGGRDPSHNRGDGRTRECAVTGEVHVAVTT